MSQRKKDKKASAHRGILFASMIGTVCAALPLAGSAQSTVESAAVRSIGASTAAGAAVVPPPPGVSPNSQGGRAGRTGEAVRTSVAAGPSCVGGLPQPTPVRINAGKSTLVNLPEPIARRTLGDPNIVDAQLVSPQVLYLVAGNIGTTNAILQGKSGRCVVLDIVVAIDTGAVKAKIEELLPAEKEIIVTAAGDSLILSGRVSDTIAGERAVSIANAYVRTRYQQGFAGGGAATGTGGTQVTTNGAIPLSIRVINMLTITAPQQVMLEVKVAEVAKKLIDRLGVSVAGAQYRGSWTYKLVSDFLLGGAAAGGSAIRNAENGIAFEADKQDGLIRILAEPSVLAISGQEGSFLAGGRIFIPVPQGGVGGTVVTLQEQTFGVGLKFTPTVLGDGRINLQVSPEVSELSPAGVSYSTGQLIGGTQILPLISTRRASTTVQLYDGQSFAIGGLIRSNSAGVIKAFPVLGELPIIGALFRSTDFQEEKTELVFVITPRLVRPLPPDYALPTDRIGPPTREGVILEGRVDSAPKAPQPSGSAPASPNAAGGMELK